MSWAVAFLLRLLLPPPALTLLLFTLLFVSHDSHSGYDAQIQFKDCRVGIARSMAQNGAPTHEIERQGRWKQGGGMVGRYTRGETAGVALRYL